MKSGVIAKFRPKNRDHFPLVVMKFGGASLATPRLVERAAERIIQKLKTHNVVVVVSAMGDETERLLHLTENFSRIHNSAEVDTVLAAGEQIAAGLMALAISQKGIVARSYLAHQLALLTDGKHGDAEILSIDTEKLRFNLSENAVSVVAGFQGIDLEGRLVTLGRGGSDTSAVAIAAALAADVCEFYKDVDAIYSADPKRNNLAQRHNFLSFEEMEKISEREPQILHDKAIKLAKKHHIRLHLRSAFNDNEGTHIEPSAQKEGVFA